MFAKDKDGLKNRRFGSVQGTSSNLLDNYTCLCFLKQIRTIFTGY